MNGRCWNKLKYPFYPCQKCIHEEHWLFNAGQMWWFLWKYVFCVEGKWKLRLGCSSSHFWRGRGWGLCICVAFMPMKASILIGVRVCHYAKADSQAYIWARMLSCNLLNLETQLTGKMYLFLDFKDLGFVYCDMCGKEWLEYYELFHILCFTVEKKAWLYFKILFKLLRICCQGSQDTLCQLLANKN